MTSSKRVAQRCAGRNILTPGRRPPLIRDLLDGAHDDLTSLREDPLTPRPTEIVKLIAESYSTRQIAETLVISEKTVHRHRTNILEKVGMHGQGRARALRDP